MTAKKKQSVTIVAAMDSNQGIGISMRLPWAIYEDLRHFKELTFGHVVIMGRLTHTSIGRPLPQRINYVLSINHDQPDEPELRYRKSLAKAIEDARKHFPDRKIFVIGGGLIYAQALPVADEMVITHIDGTYDCDAFFPHYDKELWHPVHTKELTDNPKCRVVTYRRKINIGHELV